MYPIETWQPTQATSNEASGEFFSKEKKIGVDGREAGAAKVNTWHYVSVWLRARREARRAYSYSVKQWVNSGVCRQWSICRLD